MSSIEFEKITKRYDNAVALDNVSLEVATGEFCSLVGPSGCGKTTLLRIAAGFTHPDQGKILLNGEKVGNLPPNRRNVGFVFQSYALFPTKTVAQNIGFSLALKHRPKKEIGDRVRELCELMSLNGLTDRYPHEISGGQQQRVALARALAPEPSILLLDEPLSALDAKIRNHLRVEIKRIVEVLKITAIYVTHDQEEALSISDRVAVMNAGSIIQVGAPIDVYLHPANQFVSEFIGTTNIIPCHVSNSDMAIVDGTTFPIRSNGIENSFANLSVRPEHINIIPPGNGGVDGTIRNVFFLGQTVRVTVKTVSDLEIEADIATATWINNSMEIGSQVGWTVQPGLATVFPTGEAQ